MERREKKLFVRGKWYDKNLTFRPEINDYSRALSER